MVTHARLLCCAVLAVLAALPAQAESPLPSGFVRLSEVAPTIVQDMHYAGPENFTGATVPGYEAPVCILARPVAKALARVQARLKPRGLSLKVFDCYRPKRAVASFMAWAARAKPDTTKHYYPRIPRSKIIPLGYVATQSSHSRGTTVDLTLVPLEEGAETSADAGAAKPTPAKGEDAKTSCIGDDRPGELPMGTAFDCFDELSHTHHASIKGAHKKNRALLLDAMKAEGFKNYTREWWHFSLPVPGYTRARDFVVD